MAVCGALLPGHPTLRCTCDVETHPDRFHAAESAFAWWPTDAYANGIDEFTATKIRVYNARPRPPEPEPMVVSRYEHLCACGKKRKKQSRRCRACYLAAPWEPFLCACGLHRVGTKAGKCLACELRDLRGVA